MKLAMTPTKLDSVALNIKFPPSPENLHAAKTLKCFYLKHIASTQETPANRLNACLSRHLCSTNTSDKTLTEASPCKGTLVSKAQLCKQFKHNAVEHPETVLLPKGAHHIRVMSWNIHKFRDVDNQDKQTEIIDQMSQTEADILGLQEVYQNYLIEKSSKGLAFKEIEHTWKKQLSRKLTVKEANIVVGHAGTKEYYEGLNGAWTFQDDAGNDVFPEAVQISV